MSSILFYILLSLGIIRGDLQTQEYKITKPQNSFTKSRASRLYKKTDKPISGQIIECTGQGSWEDK